MKGNFLSIFLASLFHIISLWSNGAEAQTLDPVCKDVLTSIIQRQMATLKDCMDEMHFKDGREKASKMMCVMKCALMREGFLGTDGNVDLMGSMKFLDKLPTNVKQKALNLFMTCHEHIGSIDPNEENCKSYEPMLRCCQAVINKLCYTDDEAGATPAAEATE